MADVVGLGQESKLLEILVGIAQLGSEKADGPRELHPKHEQRKRGKRAVNGVIAREKYLSLDIEQLQHLHRHTRQDAGHNGILQAHPRVGHQHVEPDEHTRHDDVGHQANQEPHHRPQQQVFLGLLGHRGDENGDTGGQHDDDGC